MTITAEKKKLVSRTGFFSSVWRGLEAFETNAHDLDCAATPESVTVAALVLAWLNNQLESGEVGQWVVPDITMDPDGIVSVFWADENSYKYASCAFYCDHLVFYWHEPKNDVSAHFEITLTAPLAPSHEIFRKLLSAMEERCPRYD